MIIDLAAPDYMAITMMAGKLIGKKLTSISPVVSKWGWAKKAFTELAKVFQNHKQYIKITNLIAVLQ